MIYNNKLKINIKNKLKLLNYNIKKLYSNYAPNNNILY